ISPHRVLHFFPTRRSSDLVIIIGDDDHMIRTQLSLDQREYRLAKKHAQGLGISVAEFVRRAVREALPAVGQSPWMKFAGLVESRSEEHTSELQSLRHLVCR